MSTARSSSPRRIRLPQHSDADDVTGWLLGKGRGCVQCNRSSWRWFIFEIADSRLIFKRLLRFSIVGATSLLAQWHSRLPYMQPGFPPSCSVLVHCLFPRILWPPLAFFPWLDTSFFSYYLWFHRCILLYIFKAISHSPGWPLNFISHEDDPEIPIFLCHS